MAKKHSCPEGQQRFLAETLVAIIPNMNQTVSQFYNLLETQFAEVAEMDLLKGIDIEQEGFENCGIMTRLAKKLTEFAEMGQKKKVQTFLSFVEVGFKEGDNTLTSYLCTDFLVTIMEQKKNEREFIKKYMLSSAKQNYKAMLEYYLELD